MKGLINDYKTNLEKDIVKYLVDKAKNKLGFDMDIVDYRKVEAATEWIKKRDKNFANHIKNNYSLEFNDQYDTPVINSKFILKVAKNTYMYVDGKVDKCVLAEDIKYSKELYIYIFGKKAYAVWKNISKCIHESGGGDDDYLTNMYSIVGTPGRNGTGSWTCSFSTIRPRPIDTLFFRDDIKEKITSHLDRWLVNEDIYNERGLIFKTGILLYGKAGTGKSSMAAAIADYLHYGLVTIDAQTFNYMNIPDIVGTINSDNNRYVILIDEIDTLFASRDNEDASDEQKKNTAKLLSFLDSPQSPNNVVFVATTNYIDRLDEALTRKGRFDLIQEFVNLDYKAAKDMCKSFNLSSSVAESIIRTFKDVNDINPVELQDKILQQIKSL
jgi:chaperone BCS1